MFSWKYLSSDFVAPLTLQVNAVVAVSHLQSHSNKNVNDISKLRDDFQLLVTKDPFF